MRAMLLILLFVLGGCKEVVVEPTKPEPTVPPVVEQPTTPPVVIEPPVVVPPVVTEPPVQPPATQVPTYEGKVVKMGVDAQTLDQAYSLVKAVGKGAILLERGKTYSGVFAAKHTIPNLTVAAYGSGERPVVKTGGKIFLFKETKTTLEKLVLKDLVVDNEGKPGLLLKWLDGGSGLMENVDFLSGGLVLQQYVGDHLKNWKLLNVKVIGAYSSGTGHMQGLYAEQVDGLTVDGCTFDHNGWNPVTEADATMYNHNLYLSEVNDVTIRNNKILNASSMGIKFRSDVAGGSKNILVENNYFLHGEIGVGVGGNVVGPDRFQNVKVINNTFEAIGATAPTKRNLAWGIGVDGDTDVVVQGNKFSAWPTFSNKWVVRVDTHVKNLTIDLPVASTQKDSSGKVQYTIYGSTK